MTNREQMVWAAVFAAALTDIKNETSTDTDDELLTVVAEAVAGAGAAVIMLRERDTITAKLRELEEQKGATGVEELVALYEEVSEQ